MLKSILLSSFIMTCCAVNNLFIWKGTRWCGYGGESESNHKKTNNSQNQTMYNEYVDNCCKEHDACPHSIPRWQRKYDLLNWRPFTISSCECDRRFLNCLNKDSSTVARDVKRIFFEILEVSCFTIKFKNEKTCLKRTWFMTCKHFTMTTKVYAEIDKA